jgi:hypothetical protein
VLRVGVVLLFLGLAFLLRYASEGMMVAVEMRYASVAACAVALLGLDWWPRLRNPNYALMLQGTAIAVLSLSVFAAMRMHTLLDPGAALGLLVLVTLFSSTLAVKQDALGPAAGTLVEVVPERAQDSNEQVLRGWLLDTSAVNTPLSKLILDWSAEREGFQRFSIEASDDLQQWRDWDDGQIARLSFADERIDQREVSLPGQSARYLRLLWSSPKQAPQLLSARVLSATSDFVPAALSWSADLQPSSAKAGQFTWELPLALPLQRIQVELAQANILAPVSVSGRLEGKVQ